MTESEVKNASPPQHAWCDVRGVRTRYAVSGARGRPPAVLLHGLGRSLEDWSETTLGGRYRVYAPDLIGFGYTEKPRGPYTLLRFAEFVRDFLEEVEEEGPVLFVGNSLGGAVAQTFAAAYPERTRGLVLVASAGFGAEVMLALRLVSVPGLGELLLRPSKRTAERVVTHLFHDRRFVTEERVMRTLELSRQEGASRAYLGTVRHLGTWRGVKAAWRAGLTERLAALALPTLIVWGARDEVLPASQLDAAKKRYPHAQAHLFADTGHAPQLERADAFNALVLDFATTLEVRV